MRNASKICVCVMAAGASSRMRCPKLLLPLAGKTMLERAVEEAIRCKADLPIVITGAYHDQMAPMLSGLPVTVVHNERWHEGQASSVGRAASFAHDNHFDALIIMAADQPYVMASTLNALIEKYEKGGDVAYASSDGVRCGNPCLFDKSCFELLATLEGDQGARSLFRSGILKRTIVEFCDHRLLEDVDTAEDYERIEREFHHER